MVFPDMRINLYVEIVLCIGDADQDRCCDESVGKAASYGSVGEACGKHCRH